MPIRFDQLASAPACALQIYIILIGCAANQQVITYGRLADRAGILTPTRLFASLRHLAEWCLLEGLPPLTSLAVAEDTGAPGAGYPLPLGELAAQQNRARKFDWYAIVPPAVADLEPTRLGRCRIGLTGSPEDALIQLQPARGVRSRVQVAARCGDVGVP